MHSGLFSLPTASGRLTGTYAVTHGPCTSIIITPTPHSQQRNGQNLQLSLIFSLILTQWSEETKETSKAPSDITDSDMRTRKDSQKERKMQNIGEDPQLVKLDL
jgi:hypothetical protein